jgi:hypothetical protein
MRKRLILLALLSPLMIRCAHGSMTRQQRECHRVVDDCMKNCDSDRPVSANDFNSRGCDDSTETHCQDRCYRDCK